jgi:hypothetical protein
MAENLSLSASSSLRALLEKWKERERKLCQRADAAENAGNSVYARASAGQAEIVAQHIEELSAALDAPLESENANQGLREGSSQPVREPEATPNAGAIRALVQDLDFAIDATEPRDVILRRFADILERSQLWR